jgi:hypothetical protein
MLQFLRSRCAGKTKDAWALGCAKLGDDEYERQELKRAWHLYSVNSIKTGMKWKGPFNGPCQYSSVSSTVHLHLVCLSQWKYLKHDLKALLLSWGEWTGVHGSNAALNCNETSRCVWSWRRKHRKQYVSVAKTSRLMLFRELASVYFENKSSTINIFSGRNFVLLKWYT